MGYTIEGIDQSFSSFDDAIEFVIVNNVESTVINVRDRNYDITNLVHSVKSYTDKSNESVTISIKRFLDSTGWRK